MQTRSSRVFERVADRIADDRRFVRIAAFAAVLSGFDKLFGIVPRAARVLPVESCLRQSD